MLIALLSALALIAGWYFEERIALWIKTELVERDLSDLCRRLVVNQQQFIEKRYRTTRNLFLIGSLSVVVVTSQGMLMSVIGLMIVSYKWPYWQLVRRYQFQLHRIRIEFPIWIRQVQVLMQTNTVIQAFEKSLSHAPLLLRNDITQLVERLNEAPCDLQSYTLFLQQFPILEVDRVMKMMYRYSIIGQVDATQQLNRVLVATTKLLREERRLAGEQHLSLYQWWGIVPLFALTTLFLGLMMNYLLNMLMKGGI